MTEFDPKALLKNLASAPGVYQMFDKAGDVIYVGKARNLKKRVSSYFSRTLQDLKTQSLVAAITNIEVTLTRTENEALLLESNLIKKYLPRYNVLLRDDKSYPYLFLSAHSEFPRLDFHRGAKKAKGKYYGPYPHGGSVRETLSLLQKLFKLRQCSDAFFQNRSRPCLQYQIKRCTAPCVNYVTPDDYQEQVRHVQLFLRGKRDQIIDELIEKMHHASKSHEYENAAKFRDQVATLRRLQEKQYVVGDKGDIDVLGAFLEMGVVCIHVMTIRAGRLLGGKAYFPRAPKGVTLEESLSSFMSQYYLNMVRSETMPKRIVLGISFEDQEWLASALSEQLESDIKIVTKVRGLQARWLEMANTNAQYALTQHLANKMSSFKRMEALQHALHLSEIPQEIECYDVSHTQGDATVASCVVFNCEGAKKSDYRRFNIHDVTPGDDYAALEQALKRRYTKLKKANDKCADIILIDGGKGQLHVAERVMEELQVSGVLLIAIAKGRSRKPGMEVLIVSGRDQELRLAADSLAMHLLQQIRDEAHRFAITAHRGQRNKAQQHSSLEDIPGIGAKRRRAILQHFGGLQEVRRAGVEAIAKVSGISLELAQKIHDALR
ncbi:MAG: excinuclease ABC subunit UvrC [Gammaproteobacteria bacterium]|nr:excinuclease ABC subunit UvrC [Gammaproteobacteria bacterium]